jgi:hypothetical protein
MRTVDAHRIWSAIGLLAVMAGVTVWPEATARAQAVDRFQPPRVEASAPGFTVHRLSSPVTIDGQTWIAVQPIIGAQTVRAPNGEFAITLEETTSVEIVHFRILFTASGVAPVQVDPGLAVYAFITPDSRWIISGTLEVIDVKNWRKYSLSKAFNIAPYVIVRAISRDGQRLVISQQDCPFDCRNFPDQYYEIRFPTD